MPPLPPSEIKRKPAEVKLPTSRRMVLLRRRERGDTRRCDDGRLPRSAKRREHLLRHRRVCSNRSGLMALNHTHVPLPNGTNRTAATMTFSPCWRSTTWIGPPPFANLAPCAVVDRDSATTYKCLQRKMRWLNENISVRRLRHILSCWAICRSYAIVKICAD